MLEGEKGEASSTVHATFSAVIVLSLAALVRQGTTTGSQSWVGLNRVIARNCSSVCSPRSRS